MKNILPRLFLLLPVLFTTGCKSGKEKAAPPAENNIDAARSFIRAALDGKFDLARTYMLADSVNTNYMDVAERSYQKTDQETKNGYRTASIHILPVTEVNDSTTIIVYSNSFKNDPDTLRVLRMNGKWLVDLKYLYEHDMDTTLKKPLLNDSLK
ncbi:MAG: DUF4878 domain-containing protein [Chitinophagaceae bacterium]